MHLLNVIPAPRSPWTRIVTGVSTGKIILDGNKRLWLTGDIFCVYDSTTHKMERAENIFPQLRTLQKAFTGINTDKEGNIYLMASRKDTLFRINKENYSITAIPIPSFGYQKATDFSRGIIVTDKEREILYCNDGKGIIQYNMKTGKFNRLGYSNNLSNSLPDSIIYWYDTDDNGNLWVGSPQNGVAEYDPQHLQKVYSITKDNGLPENYVERICNLEGTGHIAISTQSGVTLVNIKTRHSIFINSSDGLPGNYVWDSCLQKILSLLLFRDFYIMPMYVFCLEKIIRFTLF